MAGASCSACTHLVEIRKWRCLGTAEFRDSCLLSAHVTQTHGNTKLSQMVCERFVQPYLGCPLGPGAWPGTPHYQGECEAPGAAGDSLALRS